MVSKNAVKLHELINSCVLLAQRAGPIVRKVQKSGSLNVFQKGQCPLDVCSEADLRMQKTLSHNLKALFPNSKVVCEEDDQEIPDSIKPCIQPDQVLKKIKQNPMISPELLLNTSRFRRGQYQKYLRDLVDVNPDFMQASDVQRGLYTGFQDEYDQNELTFWVDPLDGSSGLAEGHTEHLTVIIGVAVNNRPLLGIVHKPFYHQNGTPVTKQTRTGRTFVGMPESGLFTMTTQGDAFSKATAMHIPPMNRDARINTETFKPKICGSHNKNQNQMNQLIKSLDPQSVERVAGSGNKFVHLTENQSDYYLNFVPGFKNWDMCGSEAILSSRFGIVTDAHQKPIEYRTDSSYTLSNGIIAAKNKSIYQLCQERIEEQTGISLEMNHHVISQEAYEIKRRRQLEKAIAESINATADLAAAL